MLLKFAQIFAGSGRILADHPIDHNLVAVGNIAKFPESVVGLGKIGQPFKPLQKVALQLLKFYWLNRSSVVLEKRYENIILFHRQPPPKTVQGIPDLIA